MNYYQLSTTTARLLDATRLLLDFHAIATSCYQVLPSFGRALPKGGLVYLATPATGTTECNQDSTPATSVSSPPPPNAAPLCETEYLKAHPPTMPQTPRGPSIPVRENPKNKYATGLVVSADQAVKSRYEIWRPQDIPTVFLTSSRANVGSCNELFPPKSRRRSTQLPSPPLCRQALQLVPEWARRLFSSELQLALCCQEAIRPKVPELIRKEQSGEGTFTEPDAESRVMPATLAEVELEALLSLMNIDFAAGNVRVYDEDIACTATPSSTSSGSEDQTKQKAGTPLSSLILLFSPLLCPRRAFLASLILASKLASLGRQNARGFPSGIVLTPTPAPVTTGRLVVRCQNESTPAIGKGSFLVQTDKKESTTTFSSATSSSPRTRPTQRGLRRCSTLPAEAFAKSNSYPATSSASESESTWNGEDSCHSLIFLNQINLWVALNSARRIHLQH
ncbi:hypothetical protein FB451DRAFT_1369066 [Mycena latifolia]|nr:hypothetical protein FB451DRAFT_1369066 [Mycena latifolia]